MSFRMTCAAVLALMMVVPVSADDADSAKKKKKKSQQRGMATQLIKRLEEVKLTGDQITKIKELGKVADAKAKEIRDKSGLTQEIMKKRAEAQKSLKDSGKKGKELRAAINEKTGLNEDQANAFKEVTAVRTKLQKDVVALLTDEQKENLPEQMKKTGKTKKRKKNKEA